MGRRHLSKLFLLVGLFCTGGCSALSMAPASSEKNNLVFTQAAETVVAQLTPLPMTQTAMFTPVPTLSILVTPTHTPTVAPSLTPTLPPIGPLPMIEVTVFTYCREGPGDGYVVDATVFPGDGFTPQGKSADGEWWYVAAPKQHRKRPSDHCWIFGGTTTSTGNLSNVPVVQTQAPITPPPGG
jgi:hypothetical protein